ncbi:hypothetical protein ABW21_db0200688 [Orbilia brochopaga]|nr:hypothetical protein ABW21_db0200688 [Drechslerella brochopaga]
MALPVAKRHKADCNHVTISVGLEKQQFKLHKNIVTLQSKFLEKFCSGAPQTSEVAELLLLRIDSDIFQIIAEYMYDGKNAIRKLSTDENILRAYKAADLLGMPQLKIDIISFINETLTFEFRHAGKVGYIKTIVSPKELVGRICLESHLEDWTNLEPVFIGKWVTEYVNSKKEFKGKHPGVRELIIALASDTLKEEQLVRTRCHDCVFCATSSAKEKR